jgi:hypothetical protein
MRPPASATEEEDDASKAEENKLINEVITSICVLLSPTDLPDPIHQEYKVW